MQNPTIFVATAEPQLRDELTELFDQATFRYEFFSTADSFLKIYDADLPGCLVLDMALPDNGGELIHHVLRQRRSVLPIILLTSLKEARSALLLLKEGALDFFEKPVDAGALQESVKNAIGLDEINRKVLRHRRELQQRLEQLTRREREILTSMLESKSSREISVQLNMSARTVEFHRARLMKKMGASSLVELVRMSVAAFGCHCIHCIQNQRLTSNKPFDAMVFPFFSGDGEAVSQVV